MSRRRTVTPDLILDEVYRSGIATDGRPLVSHAKFVAVDHRLLLLTSANFSFSAEQSNVELGVLVENPALVESVEAAMERQHGVLYERA
ncbi:MAG: phospholipase D-like domain-containing protein [Dermatophilaceae bacterium]